MNDTPPPPPARPKLITRDGGLHAATLAAVVLESGPIAPAPDGRLWAHTGGVWAPTGHQVARQRARTALAEKFRPSHLNTLVEFLKAEPGIDPTKYDPTTINVENGLLDWKTGELRPHTAEHGSTCQLPVRWNPDAECPAVDRFLAQVLKADCLEFIAEVVGYLVLVGNPLHLAILLLGPGRNGKGTFLRLVEALLGRDNIAAVTPHQLADNRFAAAALYGRTANIAGDLESRLIERTDTFKMLTGGDSIQAEHKYGASFTYRSHASMLFSANAAPNVRDHSEGFYSRWLVVPFTETIPPDKRLPEHVLDARLHTADELEGLLVAAVAGLRRLMERERFDPPASVQTAVGRFRTDTDPVAEWLEENTVLHADGWATRKNLYFDYKTWCEEAGRRPVAAGTLYRRIEGLDDVRASARSGARGFVGLTVGPKDSADSGADGATSLPPTRVYGGKG